MIKKLVLLLVLSLQMAVAQNAYFSTKGTRYPVWYSKTKALVRFSDALSANSLQSQEISIRVKRVEIIHSIPDMAYVVFDSLTLKPEFELALASLRRKANVKSAHPMLVSESGEEVAGLSDQIVARPKRDAIVHDVLNAFRALHLKIDAEDTDSEKNYYLSGEFVSNNPFEICEKLEATGLFEFAQPNY